MGKVGWSDLPEELVGLIADRLSPNIDLLRLRSICKPWRSAVATKKRFPNRFKRILLPFNRSRTELFPTTFFRVTLPSSSSSSRPNKGWLIKTRQVSESSKNTLLSPLYRHLITPSHKTLDLLKFGVSEIRQSYNVKYSNKRLKKYSNKRLKKPRNSSRAVLVDNLFFVVDYNKQIWCCKLGEENSRWTRIMNEESGGLDFSDIILHRGLIYALDLKGAIWWIHISELNIFQFTVASPMDDNMIDDCEDKRLVEYCGDLCVVHRFCDEVEYIERTLCFKVYKMDKELVEWVEMKSLGNKALIVATDSCFTVLASEYNGCLENSIYFTDDDDRYFTSGMKVFKLDDATIINMIDSSSQSCFHMFSPHFL